MKKTQEEKQQWVVIVNVVGWSNMYRPFVQELVKDCPKTIFTAGYRMSRLRWHKHDIKYQIFDSEKAAHAAIGTYAQQCIDAYDAAKLAMEEARKQADDVVKTVTLGTKWKGGKR